MRSACPARGRQPVGVQPQRVQGSEPCVGRVGFASPAVRPFGAFHLDHDQARGLECPGQPDPVTAGPFQTHDDLWTRRVIDDPGKRFGEAGLVVVNGEGGDGRSGWGRQLQGMGVAVGVALRRRR